jgi:ABC-type glycerol-3-phosphate transport system substrate-binding protein
MTRNRQNTGMRALASGAVMPGLAVALLLLVLVAAACGGGGDADSGDGGGGATVAGTATVTCAMSGDDIATSVAFDQREPDDTGYEVTAEPVASTGSPPSGALELAGFQKLQSGVSVYANAAPGSGNSVTWKVTFTGLRAATSASCRATNWLTRG